MWQVIGASTKGTSHIRQNLPCQDAYRHQIYQHCLIAAVADGLGSAKYADVGAKLAVDTAVIYLLSCLMQNEPSHFDSWQNLVHSAYLRSRDRLVEYAHNAGHPLNEYSSTLLTLVITPEWLVVGHIGDGAIVAQFEDGRLETVSVPQRGEYVNSVTPLTVDNPLSHIRLHIEQTIVNRIAILTDGLQSLCINEATNIPYDPFFMPFFHAMDQILDTTEVSQQLTHFLASERICARTDDDKTLVVIGRIQQGLQGMFAAPSTHPSITRGTDAALHNRQ